MSEIETERLLMRKYTPDDADAHLRIVSEPEFQRFMPPSYQPTRDRVLVAIGRFTEHWYQLGYGVWALESKGETGLIGYCGLRRILPTDEIELLYGIAREHWGRGLVTEAAHAALRYGFEQMNFARVMAVTVHENMRSRRVMEKCGLRYEKDARYFDVDCVYYALNREDFRQDNDALYLLRP
ncbi:MAG TPA: GNAT family N-acetyltransferase [Pyrinomonadaceae bacterium]|nr:GNAT family N-acetyltransferase [Pyrinomonadaceae bacterium]